MLSHTGEAVGTVVAVENFGATDIIEIERPDGKTFMVPLTAAGGSRVERGAGDSNGGVHHLAHQHPLFRQPVADRRRRDARLPHRVADLVEPQHHVARREQTGHGGFKMVADGKTAFVRRLCAEFHREFGADMGTQSGIDAVEGSSSHRPFRLPAGRPSIR